MDDPRRWKKSAACSTGITRAEDNLVLSRAEQRSVFGR